MFERFGSDARSVVVDAQAQARRLGHRFIGCEHLLLAAAGSPGSTGEVLRASGVTDDAVEAAVLRLLAQPEAVDRDALAAIGIDLDLVRSRIEAVFGPDALRPEPTRRPRRLGRHRDPCSGHLPFTAPAKQCLELSLREAERRRDDHIGVEHLTLALTSMTDGLVPRVLAELRVPAAGLRAEIVRRHRRAG